MKDIMKGTNPSKHIEAKKQTSTMKQFKAVEKIQIVMEINRTIGMQIIENVATSPTHMITETQHMK